MESRPINIPKLSLLAIALAIAVIWVYWPVREFDFVRIDDADYVWNNSHVRQGLTWNGLAWAWTTGFIANWHPLTWMSHMLDVQMFGVDRAGPHHLMNVAIHAVNAALLLIVLYTLTGSVWRSALVAGLFALHPLRVESVAWVSERKDVLSTFLGLLAVAAYVWWIRARAEGQSRTVKTILVGGLVILFYALSLTAKPMLVTLPFLLLVLDVWPLRRLRPQGVSPSTSQASMVNLILEKIPLVALAAASSVVTYFVQNRVGAVATAERLPLVNRAGNAIVSYARYVEKTIWPTGLELSYPHPISWPVWSVVLSASVLIVITITVVCLRRSSPWLVVGWLWFLGTLVPVIGLVQVGTQAMADRYTYFPQIGLLIMFAWSAGAIARNTAFRGIATSIALVILTLLACGSRRQVMVWQDTETLCKHAVSVSPDNWLMQHTLGLMYLHQKKLDLAAEQFRIAEQLNPNHPEAASNLGDMRALQHRSEEAVQAYRRALDRDPNRPGTLNNLAVILSTHADARLRDGALAVRLALRANELTDQHNAGYLFTLAAAYAEAGQFDLALGTAQRALDLAEATGQSGLADSIRTKMALFRKGQPSRDYFVDPDAAK